MQSGHRDDVADAADLEGGIHLVIHLRALAQKQGFGEELADSFTEREIELLPMAGIIMTFECGIRFLADYLSGDTYFKIHREKHNLDRARNQFKLVADMESKMDEMKAIVKKVLNK